MAELPRILRVWELALTMLGIGGFFLFYWQLLGFFWGGIVTGGSLVFLLLLLLTARSWTSLQEFMIYIPVIGSLYESFFRRDTYQQQDHRLIYASLVNTIIRSKVTEFCAAGGVEKPEFVNVSNPEQVLSRRELSKYLEKPDDFTQRAV